jgi:hypothetical protein
MNFWGCVCDESLCWVASVGLCTFQFKENALIILSAWISLYTFICFLIMTLSVKKSCLLSSVKPDAILFTNALYRFTHPDIILEVTILYLVIKINIVMTTFWRNLHQSTNFRQEIVNRQRSGREHFISFWRFTVQRIMTLWSLRLIYPGYCDRGWEVLKDWKKVFRRNYSLLTA